MVKVVKRARPELMGKVGYVSMITGNVYMVTFIKNRVTTCGFFFDYQIEVIKRGPRT